MGTIFKDKNGKQWDCNVTVGAVKRVKNLCGFNLIPLTGEKIKTFYDDIPLFVDVVYSVIKPQADKCDITDEQFGEALDGDAIYLATSALLEGVVNFTPNPKQRAMMEKLLKSVRDGMEYSLNAAEKEMEKLDLTGEIQKKIDCIASQFQQSTNSPEPSE